MEITTEKVDLLLTLLSAKLRNFETGREPDTDWSQWNEIIGKLRDNILFQLESCQGRISDDVYSVGSLASHQDVMNALQQAKEN